MKKLIFLIIAVAGILAISGCGKEKVYTVTFDANGGTGEMKEQIFVKNVAQPLISNAFIYELKSFSDWNTVPDGSGVMYSDAQEITINNDITLYAQWEQSVFKITFDANGGTGSMSPISINRGEGKALPENAFTRSGYIFYGWATSANGEVAYSNKASIKDVSEDLTLYALWTKPEGGRQAVDLGLPSGLKWASCNVGANNPEEYGDIFRWGETEPMGTYSTYIYYDNSTHSFTKYTGSNGDGLTTLEASDDAATANWGAGWRMPTAEEVSELLTKCHWESGLFNGENGYVVVGSNGKSIFLPAKTFSSGEWGGYYWTSTLCDGNSSSAGDLVFVSWPYPRYFSSLRERSDGDAVRAVCN